MNNPIYMNSGEAFFNSIRLEHLGKKYDTCEPLKDVNVTINRGDVISVIGPSGTGKSTLLNCINLLDPPTGGRIFLDDREVTNDGIEPDVLRQHIGMVFQSFNLFANMTVIENLMIAPKLLKGRDRDECRKRGFELLEKVGLSEKAYSYPDELSGGQKQRVAIARALAMDPEMILFDEPTSALDPTMVDEVQSVISMLAKTGITMMIVTHDMRFAKNVSNRVFYLDEGGIYEDGTPEQIFEAPKREKTREFILRAKIFEYEVHGKDFSPDAFYDSLARFTSVLDVSPESKFRMNLLFEELFTVQIYPLFGDEDSAKITILLNSDEVVLKVSVNLEVITRMTEDGDAEISRSILKGMSKSIEERIENDTATISIVV